MLWPSCRQIYRGETLNDILEFILIFLIIDVDLVNLSSFKFLLMEYLKQHNKVMAMSSPWIKMKYRYVYKGNIACKKGCSQMKFLLGIYKVLQQ